MGASKEFTDFARARKRDADHEAKQEVQVTEWIVETFDGLDDSHASNSSTTVSNLCEKARGAMQNDPRLLDLLSSTFSRELVADPSLKSSTSRGSSRLASARRHSSADMLPTTAQLSAAE